MKKLSYYLLSHEEKRLYDLFIGNMVSVDVKTTDWDDDITYTMITYKHPGYPDRVTEVAVNDMNWITTYISVKGTGRVAVTRTKASDRLSRMMQTAASQFIRNRYDNYCQNRDKEYVIRLQNFLNGALTDKDFKD